MGYRDFSQPRQARPGDRLEKAVLDELMLGLGARQALIGTCLLDRLNAAATLHPLVRDEVLRRHRTSGRVQDSNPWRLRGDRRMAVHDRLAEDMPTMEILTSATRWNPCTMSCWDRVFT